MIGPAQFQAMKHGSYFIALTRGKHYDMPSSVNALDSKQLVGAGVDVTEPEPLLSGHAPTRVETAIVTPQVASQGVLGSPRRVTVYLENIERFEAGERLINVGDMRMEY